MEMVGLAGRAHHRPYELSGGEQQRVAIARSLANSPALILADEPTGELDTHTSEEIFDLFSNLNKDLNVTIIVVTHDPAIAASVDRVVAIRDGRIATETYRHYEYSAAGEREVVHREYAVVDRAGRLQIPKPYMDALDLRERARVLLTDDHITIYPEDAGPERDDSPANGGHA
jgi:ABC-type glutathione transport system ATPase component